MDYHPDLILVSPLNRALQTCSHLYPDAECPIIVLPVLAEGLRSACDFSSPIEPKKTAFPKYDFSQVEKLGPYWYIYNDDETNQTHYWKLIDQHPQKDYQQVVAEVLKDSMSSFTH